jgi:hypothetical protein
VISSLLQWQEGILWRAGRALGIRMSLLHFSWSSKFKPAKATGARAPHPVPDAFIQINRSEESFSLIILAGKGLGIIGTYALQFNKAIKIAKRVFSK